MTRSDVTLDLWKSGLAVVSGPLSLPLYRKNAKSWRQPALNRRFRHCGLHVISTRIGISFFTGMVNNEGGSILKSVSVAGIVPVMCFSLP